MVNAPPPRPPGRNPNVGDVVWCTKHKAWATWESNGKYRCPFGHTLGSRKPFSKGKG
jgi:hypothetical protein